MSSRDILIVSLRSVSSVPFTVGELRRAIQDLPADMAIRSGYHTVAGAFLERHFDSEQDPRGEIILNLVNDE